jgi:hypothetical protein
LTWVCAVCVVWVSFDFLQPSFILYSWAMKNSLGDKFEPEIWAEIATEVRPKWSKPMTIRRGAQQRPSHVLWRD